MKLLLLLIWEAFMNPLNVIQNHKKLRLHGILSKKKETISWFKQYFLPTNLSIITIHFGRQYGSFLTYLNLFLLN